MPSSVTRSGSWPKVPAWRPQRGSVARSRVGCRAARMPTATYSCRAMSANSRTASVSRSAARPSGSGHCENAFAEKETPAFSRKACRGSVETVTGMPCGVRSASACRALCQRAAIRGSSSPCTLKWVRCLSSTTTLVGDLLIAPAVSTTVPSAPASMTVWNIRPDLLLERQPAEQVLDPGVDVEARVLVGVHDAVAVEVAEPHALRAGHPWAVRPGAWSSAGSLLSGSSVGQVRARRWVVRWLRQEDLELVAVRPQGRFEVGEVDDEAAEAVRVRGAGRGAARVPQTYRGRSVATAAHAVADPQQATRERHGGREPVELRRGAPGRSRPSRRGGGCRAPSGRRSAAAPRARRSRSASRPPGPWPP